MDTATYSEPVDAKWCDLMTVAEFKEQCQGKALIDYDGFGHPVKDGMEDHCINIKPSKRHEIPEDATHIAWNNK